MSHYIVRRSDFVRQLSPDADLSLENAQIDRIHMDIGSWALFGGRDQICSALSQLHHTEVNSPEGECVQLFNQQVFQGVRDIQHLRFNSNPNRDSLNNSAPLLSGKGDFASWRYSPSSRRPDERARILFKTQLNLTRFLQAQRLKRITRLDRPRLASNYVLAISPEENWYVDEIPLRPATNIIIGSNKKYAFALKRPRAEQLRDYLDLVQDTLDNAMQDAFEGSEATAEHIPHFTIKEIEFYWEFDSNDPIDFVYDLQDVILVNGDTIGVDLYETTHPSLEVTNQSPCLTIRLTQNIAVKVYAKTTRRVRFEVKLKDAGISTRAGGRAHDSVDGIVNMLPALADEAATRLSPVLQSIAAGPAPTGSFTAVELMHRIVRAADDPHAAETIIAFLVSFGRVAPYGNDPLLRAIRNLADNGILRTHRPRSRIYVITDEYRDALASLRRLR